MVEKQGTAENFHIAVERAIDELRRQMGLVIRGPESAIAVFPVEFMDKEALEFFRSLPGASVSSVISGARARSAGFAAIEGQAIEVDAAGLSFEQVCALADPLSPKVELPPLTVQAANDTCGLALILAKAAALLPALVLIKGNAQLFSATPFPGWQSISSEAIHNYIQLPLLEVTETASAKLPIEGAENCSLLCFRARHSASVHLALLIGDPLSIDAPLTRIHSSCVTGDILNSLRCDCGDQLHMAIDEIRKAGGGVLLYLHQEGRGIGITNKLRAYKLQEQGVDTYDANLMLGFEEDERDFAVAAVILKKLKLKKIRLLTNNPKKIASLEKNDIAVTERVPLVTPSGRHNHAYLDAKAKKSGHLF